MYPAAAAGDSTVPNTSSPSPALPYFPAASGRWPAETRAIVAAAVAVSVVGLATSAKILWMWLAPTLFRQSGVAPWPLVSVSSAILLSRVLFDVMVICGAVTAIARSRVARPILLTGAVGLVIVITFAPAWSAVLGPPGWGRYKGADSSARSFTTPCFMYRRWSSGYCWCTR